MHNICAIATPPGGALGIIRVSGPRAISITQSIFRPEGKHSLESKRGGTLTFGRVVDPASGEVVDEVLVSLFRAPHSYTGEDSCEISCHGSAYILERVVQLLLGAGCQLARPGEYTERAFLNGKMDLSQAEAVADLIASTTEANHRMAMQQMRGAFSTELRGLRDELLHITSLLELELDFSDHEELEFASRPELLTLAHKVEAHLRSLCQSFKLGNALKRGIPIAIVGETNAGKSTLLNTLVGEERALVSEVKGTTRDTIEEALTLGTTLVRFIDTAGIRHTSDEVEQMGINRTFAKMHEADIVLWLIDLTQWREQFSTLAPQILPQCQGKRLVVMLNKQDLAPASTLQEAQSTLTSELPQGTPLVALSARNPEAMATLTPLLTEQLQAMQASLSATGTIVSNLRHYEALASALEAVERVIAGLDTGLSGDFVSQDLRECIYHLSDIVGEVTTDDVLGNIFKNFCIGK